MIMELTYSEKKYASIVTVYNNTALFIAGDLDSRIKDLLDYIPNDDVCCIFDESVPYPSHNFEISRKLKDKVCYKFGLSLIHSHTMTPFDDPGKQAF